MNRSIDSINLILENRSKQTPPTQMGRKKNKATYACSASPPTQRPRGRTSTVGGGWPERAPERRVNRISWWLPPQREAFPEQDQRPLASTWAINHPGAPAGQRRCPFGPLTEPFTHYAPAGSNALGRCRRRLPRDWTGWRRASNPALLVCVQGGSPRFYFHRGGGGLREGGTRVDRLEASTLARASPHGFFPSFQRRVVV